MSSVIIQSFFFPRNPKILHMLLEGFRSLGLFREGKTHIIATFRRTHLVICSHSREGKTLSYIQINMVYRILLICNKNFRKMVSCLSECCHKTELYQEI